MVVWPFPICLIHFSCKKTAMLLKCFRYGLAAGFTVMPFWCSKIGWLSRYLSSHIFFQIECWLCCRCQTLLSSRAWLCSLLFLVPRPPSLRVLVSFSHPIGCIFLVWLSWSQKKILTIWSIFCACVLGVAVFASHDLLLAWEKCWWVQLFLLDLYILKSNLGLSSGFGLVDPHKYVLSSYPAWKLFPNILADLQ